MKILFINCAYPTECKRLLSENSNLPLQASTDTFQWAVIDGLDKNRVDYTLACAPALPAWPCYKTLYTPDGIMAVNNRRRGRYLRYCDVPFLKQISIRRVLYRFANQWCKENRDEDELCILVYSQQSSYLGSAISLKRIYKNLMVVPIVTDLIECAMEYKSNRGILKRIQMRLEQWNERCLFPKVDKYVLLSKQMTECIPEANNRYIVVEGIAPKDSIENNNKSENKSEERILLYTGVLEEYAGVRLLVNAFRKVSMDNAHLLVCGSGTDSAYVLSAAAEDPRIEYRGQVDREEAVRLQKKATLLINPRQPNGGITKYSFPSKTMEYMTSGTPMIGYHLEGIPVEYFEHMFCPMDLSEKALTDCITNTLSLSYEQLKNKSDSAQRFVVENKNSREQVFKIIRFMSDN